MKFHIEDWAGNVKFNGKEFKSFTDGWDFLMSKFDKDEDLGEFYVLEGK